MDGRLNLTAGAFNQLGQHTSRGYCYAESPFSFLMVAVTITITH